MSYPWAGFLTGRGSLPYNRIVGGDPSAYFTRNIKEFDVLFSRVVVVMSICQPSRGDRLGKQDLKIDGSREVIVDARKKENFEKLWLKYFGGEELPLTFFYTDDEPAKAQVPKAPKGHRCIIGDLARARRGKSLAFTAQVVGCPGASGISGSPMSCFPISSISSPAVSPARSKESGTRRPRSLPLRP